MQITFTSLVIGMEGGDQSLGNGGSRWNPTKEQINMLESLYKQGLRTPTAEQIQQITARLRDFGHIEGKNVFYWFQNHKARQRQKQKQESFAYYNRSFIHPTPLFPSYPTVVCSPCYITPTKSDAVYYHQYPKVPLPTSGGSFKRSRLIPDQSFDQRYNKKQEMRQVTLDLFPIHPTGILQSRNGNRNSYSNNPSMSDSSDQNESVHANHGCDDDKDEEEDGHPFFDFFCGNS